MVAPPPPAARQRFRIVLSVIAFMLFLSLVALAPTASASVSSINVKHPEKKCIEVHEDYDLRNMARDSNVFLIVHHKDDEDKRVDLCNKFESTPDQKWEEVVKKGKAPVFAYLTIGGGYEDEDGNWNDGGASFAKNTLGVVGYPSFLYITKGMDKISKYSNHVTRYTSSTDSNNNMLDMSDVANFMEKKLGFRIGNDVFNIIFFDTIASRFVSYGDAKGINRIKQHILALYVRTATLFSYKEPFSSIGNLYNRAFAMSFEHGINYCGKQMKKLEKKVEKNKNNMSEEEAHALHQKIAILRSFAEPKVLTADDHKQLFMHAMLHLGLVVATLLFILVPSNGDDEDEEAINAVPIIAKFVEDDGKSAKKTK